MTTAHTSIESYIRSFPAHTQKLLRQMRATIRKSAPTAIEAISYGMPTFKLNGNLVHFAGYNAHIGFYPAPSGLRAFREQISLYKNSKGAVQFPLDKKLPLKLVADIVRFRVRENTVKELKQSGAEIFSGISAPARRALDGRGIKTLRQLARMSESQVLELHGMGKTTIPKLKALLKAEGLAFIKGNDKPK